MSVFMFPGQGSQKKGMGGELFARFPSEAAVASRIVGYSMEALCVADAEGKLDNTRYTQPALFTVNALHYLAMQEEGGSKPRYFIGHSLGEYNALHAAGAIDFSTGVELTMLRGRLMSEAREGGMAAVLGIGEEDIRAGLREAKLDRVYVANLNAPTQTVISGETEQLRAALQWLGDRLGAVCVELNVSGAFHSPLMEDARAEFGNRLAAVAFREPVTPVIANVGARPYVAGGMRAGLEQQLTSPVRWTDTIRYLLDQGETEFVEVGPGRVLTQLVDRIRRSAHV
ncbi:ACP S-malonyltransferase [Trinickia sp. YCB016]